MVKVSKKSITIWNLETLSKVLAIEIVAGVCFYFFNEYTLVKKICTLGFIGGLLYTVWDVTFNSLLYKWYAYKLDDKSLFIKKGGFSVIETLVPFKRIQHVSIEQTFYSRFFNLYQVIIYTAGDSHSIGFLSKNESEKLKKRIIDYLIDMGVDIDEQTKR
ncbi:PH domain-containing protein [Bacillus haynesii]|uniref:PH domain-containing protein n=1 Tax=Bacillus haynesii TaxID=1925021 RepID=UPI002DB79B4F|nr:PH domain-containing protein [Bacillus haynesii]MEC1657237.1 PH domain-containing protein [Bacillus haynesii]